MCTCTMGAVPNLSHCAVHHNASQELVQQELRQSEMCAGHHLSTWLELHVTNYCKVASPIADLGDWL